MISFLRQIVHFEKVFNEFTVINAVFKEDFGSWRKDQHCEALQIFVDRKGNIWLEEYAAALLIKKCQITLGVVA